MHVNLSTALNIHCQIRVTTSIHNKNNVQSNTVTIKSKKTNSHQFVKFCNMEHGQHQPTDQSKAAARASAGQAYS